MQFDKIKGMFLGVAIGDALGMPVESWSAEKIAEIYGRVTELKVPEHHKWFAGQSSGTITDDTQLTIAVAESLIEADLDMDSQAKFHVAALKDTDAGWGRTTREAIRRLANGVNWQQSGTGGDGTGTGNGVAMKVSPLGLYAVLTEKYADVIDFTNSLNLMTHRTSLSASSALAMVFAVKYCFACKTPASFKQRAFSNMVLSASKLGSHVFPETLSDDISIRLENLFNNISEYTPEKMIAEFGCGSCYCYNSIPFTLGFFLRNPNSIDCLYDVINAGGDTDSNGSMVGALLGALHGASIFPQHLIDGLVEKDRILAVVDRFCEKFGVEIHN